MADDHYAFNNEFLKKLRKHRKMSQAIVAQALSMSRSTYIAIEGGSREPTFSEVLKLAELFGIDERLFRHDCLTTYGLSKDEFSLILK